MKNRVLASGWIAVLLVALPSLAGAELRPAAQEFEVTDALLGEIAAEVRPLVCETLGVKLENVAVRVASREEIEDALVAENTPILAGVGAGDAAADQARDFAASLSPGLLAKYAFEERAVLVQADAFEVLSHLIGIPELASEPVLRAVILHELVHAADDETHNMTAFFASCDSADAIRIRNAILEGHAQMVARDLAERAGCAQGFEIFTRAIATPPVTSHEEGAALEMMARAATSFMAFNYITGEAFFQGVRAGGGDEAVRRAFSAPPRDPVVIVHPEWFLHPELRPRAVFELDPALETFASAFEGDEDWTLNRVSVSPTDLTAAMAPLPEDEIRVIADSLRQSRVQVAMLGQGEAQLVLGLFEFGSPDEAAAYLEAYARLQRLRDDMMKEGTVRILSAEYVPLTAPRPAGVVVEKRIAVGAVNVDLSALCVTRGALAVEALASNAPDWSADDLLEAALDALDQLTQPHAEVDAR